MTLLRLPQKLCIIVLFTSLLLTAQERYSQIALPAPSPSALHRLEELGIAADHFDGKVGGTISLFVSESELQRLDRAGIAYTVLIKDWQTHYDRMLASSPLPSASAADSLVNFVLGSKGGHFTLEEIDSNLVRMQRKFPHLITVKDAIGMSVENREIWCVKISDNPETDEPAEPEVMYTALHHAREPQGMMTVIYYMWWLLENYGNDPEATYLVDNRQMWFIPVVNPDGYQYNAAGGLWRKNRRVLKNGTTFNYGIDLNRNYGPYHMWDAPNGGSSTNEASDTYRGVEPFSEPETQAIRDFMATRRIRTAFNYHTYGNYIIYPWGYSSMESPDSLLFRQWTFDMSMINRYSIGTDQQTVGYSTRGNSDDFMYGDTSKPRAYAMTPEVGTTGFWAAPADIIPLAKINLLQNKLLSFTAGGYPELRSFTRNGNTLSVVIRNKGTEPLPAMTLTASSTNSTVTSSVQTRSLLPFTSDTVSLSFSSSSPSVTIRIKDGTAALLNDSITFYNAAPVVLFADSAASTANWTMGSWGLVQDAPGVDMVFTDSPSGNYSAGSDNIMKLNSPVDLSGYPSLELRFRTKWAIESTWDFATVDISTNAGSTWTPVRTKYMRKGSGRSSVQPLSAYGFDAFVPGLTWVEQSADLSSFAGKQILLRFRLRADSDQQRDGWYVDDIRILGYPTTPNSAPVTAAPGVYALEQNFPNPFNPSTVIRFSIAERGPVTMELFNTLGQRVATIAEGEFEAGTHAVKFDARQLSSGLYFYRLKAGAFSDVKRMSVVK